MKSLLPMVIFMSLVSCRYDEEYSTLSDLKDSKDEVQKVVTHEMNDESQLKLKNYFAKIAELTYALENNSKLERYFHRKFKSYFDASICPSVILSNDVYLQISQKCIANNFYICAEEVRHYKNFLKTIKNNLTNDELDQIMEDEKCKKLLIDLEI